MLFFDYLKNLDAHIALLQKKIKDKHTLFLVGGCVRDPLLGLEKKPTDIDFTMAGDPKKLDKLIDKKWMSYFMTEKFGTITLIQKNLKKAWKIWKKTSQIWENPDTSEKSNRVSLSDSSDNLSDISVIKYELTPLRTESNYEDFRHPEEITRSNDLLLDSQRRDFTINCMYYTNAPYKAEYISSLDKKNIHNYSDDETFLKRLDDHGYLYIKDLALLIIQDHKHIAKLFDKGMYDDVHLKTMLKSATVFMISTNKKNLALNTKHLTLRILVDPHKGIHDCIHKRLKAVGDPDKRFTEDALRIIRAIRFVNVLNEKLKNCWNVEITKKHQLNTSTVKHLSPVVLFDYEKATWNSVKKNHELIKNVAKERIKEEIMKAFTVGNPFGFVALLDEAGLLEHLFPALFTTKYIEQPIRYHPFDIYTHTLLTLFELQKINKDPLVRLAMLYHDVGKVDQFGAYAEWLTKEEIREILAGPLNHRRSSPEYAKKDFRALGFSSKEITAIARYIANHHKPEEMLMSKEDNTEKKVRTFFSEAGYENAMNILDITMADRLWQYNPLQNSSDISDIDKLRIILKKLQKQEWQFTMKHLAVNGSDIIKQFKLKPGPAIWVLLKKTLARVMSDLKTKNTKKQIYGFLGTQIKHLNK